MKRIISFVFCLLMVLSICACNTPTPTPGQENNSQENQVQYAQYNALFDTNNHISIRLDISHTELVKMQEDYYHYTSFGSKSPIYRRGNLAINITKPTGEVLEWNIEDVGVRMKGNTSRNDFYSSQEGMYSLIHFKLSFQETFDQVEYYGEEAQEWEESAKIQRQSRTFATLEKMDLRWNRNDDTTYIREGFSYDIYREFGVLAPHTNLTSFDVGGEHLGVYTLYEPIDKTFLEKNLPASALGGDLYKLGWTGVGATFTKFTSYGVEDEDAGQFYIYDLKTNKSTSDHGRLKTLIETLNKSSLTKEDFASVVDVENFLAFCAVSYMAGNPDDLRNNYNNCYIYFTADTGKMMLIPYDLDRCYGVNVWNPYGHGMTQDSPFSTNVVGGEQVNPLFSKTISVNGLFLEEYIDALVEVKNSPSLTVATFAQRFQVAKQLYAADTTPSKQFHNCSWYTFAFDIGKTAGANESANMSYADYMQAKLYTLNSYLDDPTKPDGYTPLPYAVNLYIRADFTNWEMQDSHKMTEVKDGVYAFTIHCSRTVHFKVYNDVDQRWFGTECMTDESDVPYETDGHTNVVLEAGSYIIYFNTATKQITLAHAN